MSSASKRKEITTPPVSQKKKPSQRVRFNKNKKLRWENAEKTKQESIPPVPASSMELDIIFNPSKVLILFLPPYTEKLLISYFFVLIRELRNYLLRVRFIELYDWTSHNFLILSGQVAQHFGCITRLFRK